MGGLLLHHVSATVAEILSTVADRFSLEIAFRDCKEIVGAGQQQVRFVWANIGAFHICLWTFTMTEAWAWGRRRTTWWTAEHRHGTIRTVAQATQTSVGLGAVNCWPRRLRGSTPRGHRGGNSGRRRAVACPGGMRAKSIAESAGLSIVLFFSIAQGRA